jgi:hypothetical protein
MDKPPHLSKEQAVRQVRIALGQLTIEEKDHLVEVGPVAAEVVKTILPKKP